MVGEMPPRHTTSSWPAPPLREEIFLRTEVIDIAPIGTATTIHFDPTQAARLSLQVDFQRGIITIQTQAAEADRAERAAHNTGELEQCALTQAVLEDLIAAITRSAQTQPTTKEREVILV